MFHFLKSVTTGILTEKTMQGVQRYSIDVIKIILQPKKLT